MICRHYFVSGRVQGVFFRVSTRQAAESAGVAGWVRNRLDGRVEVLAAGSREALDELEKWLQTGPDHAKVANIEVLEQPCSDAELAMSDFEIRPTPTDI